VAWARTGNRRPTSVRTAETQNVALAGVSPGPKRRRRGIAIDGTAGRVTGQAGHPNATSNVIITAKPIIAPIVETSEIISRCDSGISSSTTT
jgi:hypothetical protein